MLGNSCEPLVQIPQNITKILADNNIRVFLNKGSLKLKESYDAVYVVLPMYAVIGIDRSELL